MCMCESRKCVHVCLHVSTCAFVCVSLARNDFLHSNCLSYTFTRALGCEFGLAWRTQLSKQHFWQRFCVRASVAGFFVQSTLHPRFSRLGCLSEDGTTRTWESAPQELVTIGTDGFSTQWRGHGAYLSGTRYVGSGVAHRGEGYDYERPQACVSYSCHLLVFVGSCTTPLLGTNSVGGYDHIDCRLGGGGHGSDALSVWTLLRSLLMCFHSLSLYVAVDHENHVWKIMHVHALNAKDRRNKRNKPLYLSFFPISSAFLTLKSTFSDVDSRFHS